MRKEKRDQENGYKRTDHKQEDIRRTDRKKYLAFGLISGAAILVLTGLIAGSLYKDRQEVPSEAPELVEGTDLEDPAEEPEYVPQELEETPEETQVYDSADYDAPHGEGAIYVNGFGWVEYEGPNVVIDGSMIKENGVKVGEM